MDYVHLFAPAYRRLKELVAASPGGASSVVTIESDGYNHGPFRAWSPLLDYGPHDVSMCLDLLGHGAEFGLIDAKRVLGNSGELFEARCELGTAAVMARVGNGARSKARRFAVTLGDGRRIVYDDCQAHPNKLVDEGTPVLIDETLPLDAALTHFLQQQRRWALDRNAICDGEVWLDLSVRVAEILDAIADAIGNSG